MILLIPTNADASVYDLTEQKEYIVGRKNCEILITGDQSISRKHAIVYVTGNEVFLEDCNSKYKTSCNNIELEPNKKVKVKNKDTIKFGALHSIYTLEMVKWATTCSGFSSAKKEDLKKELNACNVKFFDQWNPYCTHLTVEVISLTIKVLQAIIDEKPIVIPVFWKDLNNSLKNGTAAPDAQNYKPPLAEILLNKFDFAPNPNRKELFKGKVFVFLTDESKDQFEAIINSCGGESISWQSKKLTAYDMKISPKEYLIMQSDEIDNEPSLKSIVSDFQKQGKRPIPIQEIGLAVLLGSCERDCNPGFNRVGKVFPDETVRAPTQSRALVEETQSQETGPRVAREGAVVPQSVEDGWMEVDKNKENAGGGKGCSKRVQEEQDGPGPTKKVKVEGGEERDKQEQLTAKDLFTEKNTTSAIPKKRKADEKVTEPEAKKYAKQINPFALMRPCSSRSADKPNVKANDNPFAKLKKPRELETSSQVSKENPFASMSIRREKDANVSEIPLENPFRSAKRVDSSQRNENRIFHSTLLGEPGRENISRLSKTTKVSTQNVTWLSKDMSRNVTVKHEEIDPEYEKVVELFKNCVKIEIMEITKRNVSNVSNASTVSNGKKNFKKFKKVNPINPQCTIIGRNQLIKYAPRGASGDIDQDDLINDDENYTNEAPPPKRKQFIF